MAPGLEGATVPVLLLAACPTIRARVRQQNSPRYLPVLEKPHHCANEPCLYNKPRRSAKVANRIQRQHLGIWWRRPFAHSRNGKGPGCATTRPTLTCKAYEEVVREQVEIVLADNVLWTSTPLFTNSRLLSQMRKRFKDLAKKPVEFLTQSFRSCGVSVDDRSHHQWCNPANGKPQSKVVSCCNLSYTPEGYRESGPVRLVCWRCVSY